MPPDEKEMRAECAGKFGVLETTVGNIDRRLCSIDAKLDTLRSRPTWFVSVLLGAFLSLLTAFIVFAATQHP